MKLVNFKLIDMVSINPKATGKIYSLALDITDIEVRAEEMYEVVTDTSWLDHLDIVDSATYSARSKPTIKKIVDDILNNVESEISEEFGEYMVSDSAQTVLKNHLNHIRLPLAELIKEKISGNPGFDFHTETPESLVSFGEAKYSGSKNAHGRALSQIKKFISAKKDIQELSDLRTFVTKEAINNAAAGKKSFCAAFSIVSDNIESIMDNVLSSVHLDALLSYEAVYLVGVKVSA